MPRTYFSKAAQGNVSPSGIVVADLQMALNASGCGPIDTDGLFGGQSVKALTAFQKDHGLPLSGTVTDATWTALMHSAEPPIFERCLQLTASFEGTGFTEVVGNFDGAGITWGIIGFTLKNGELGRILSAVNQRYPALINKAFGGDAALVLRITTSNDPDEKIAWANSISRGTNKYRVAEPWKTYFRDLGSYPEVQKLQVDRARNVYWKIAQRDAQALAMHEELDLMLLYDIAVQNGGMDSKDRLNLARAEFKAHPPKTARAKRDIVGTVVANTSNPRYKADVLSRKLSISAGTGTVHGGHYLLADWGFLDGKSPQD